ncbi:M48 family metallopeptidase [Dysgonomonas sp. GY75]|uniref:M48 family metallopeptidase n=1 Tax=Dysgonomonas sp. GY75 TaxID=2780419 RepID=UPI0018843393|nr:SprT family zinc-dependent metalloprotease [Dysgonomonas sp. GY75]MBF0650087.1 M48 family metallopeptidase [Dysgonomonas sp. GY75]
MTLSKITYGNTEIAYNISYCNRKTLGITVNPDSTVLIKAPIDSGLEQIEQKVRKRAKWILKQQLFFKSFGDRLPPRRYVSGESHFYLGRQYILKVIIGHNNQVKYKGRFIEVTCTNKIKVKALLDQWYRERAKIKFAEIAEPLIQQFRKYKVEPSSIFIQEMQTRWGSCTNKRKIILNTELIKVPKPCIEYVIIHELCHLIYQGHTKEFYKLLGNEMPSWSKWKNKLEMFL